VLKFPNTIRESQSEGGKTCHATPTLPKRPHFFEKLALSLKTALDKDKISMNGKLY
jgi:hypothetical protein